MAPTDVEKVLQLKLQLKESTEGHTLLKTLKKLQQLDVTLDILAETGIGKVVNSFRKHSDAGEVAKTLVHRWKKLVPRDSPSVTQPQPPPLKEPSKSEVQESDRTPENTNDSERKPKNENSGSECKPSKNSDSKSKVKRAVDKSKAGKDGEKKDSDSEHVSPTPKKSSQPKEKSSGDGHAEQKDEQKKPEKKVSDITNKHRTKTPTKTSSSKRDGKKKRDLIKKEDSGEKRSKPRAAHTEKDLQSDDFETPSMSFEAYLSYDLEAPKRKRKSCDDKTQKRLKTDLKEDAKVCVPSIKSSKAVKEESDTTVSKGSVLDLLKIPLPPISPECEDLSQYQYFAKRKVEDKPADVSEEAPVFTGQRLNRKMQVYSGSKVVYLPTMMTLYQQCIRTLQNNIDSLYEIGGVPFEILEPVLERCTPEQLLRIEECNPVYIGVTDHLWERHCQRDFRNAQLEEYESWRELYLRLFEERERKLQRLTKSIVLAHSGKPKGRQVKMAFIHSAAKPPRNVRIQQELHGTASAGLPHPADKPSGKSHDSRGRPCFSEPTSSGSSQCPDPRRIRRVAPMMAKSLKAFKKQLGRR
ncbi:elongin A, like [Colossoma macropomum]|uniref:elongin A, like n=1 Tax=Colossoma macropomum TaxID=42526 RepID=UPI0018655F8C|nr:elongin A, like [Colossoma macropomum]